MLSYVPEKLRGIARFALVLCTVTPLCHNFSTVVWHTVFAMRCNCVTNLPQSITWVCSYNYLVYESVKLWKKFQDISPKSLLKVELNYQNSRFSLRTAFDNCLVSISKLLANPRKWTKISTCPLTNRWKNCLWITYFYQSGLEFQKFTTVFQND